MKEEALSQRLSAAAGFVPMGAITADVGADHAALSLFLLQKGIAPSVIVSDVNPLPLERARKAFEGSEYQSKVTFSLADGIVPLLRYHPDCFVVAGMGGETIAGMLESHRSDFIGKTFVFQPMTKIAYLREYLGENGFCIQKEKVVTEHKRPFVIMKCAYDGEKRRFSPLENLAGKDNLASPDQNILTYFALLRKQLRKQIDGIEKTGRDPGDLKNLLRELEGFGKEES